MRKYFFMLFFIFALTNVTPLKAQGLTDEQIEDAKRLAKSNASFESYLYKEETSLNGEENRIIKSKKPDWLTLEEIGFDYGGSWIIANSFMSSSVWGEMVFYPPHSDMKAISLFVPGWFSTRPGLSYFASLSYQYIPESGPIKAHFIIQKPKLKGKLFCDICYLTCLNYFLEKFVAKRTEVPFVLCDLGDQPNENILITKGFLMGIPFSYAHYSKMKKPSFWANPSSRLLSQLLGRLPALQNGAFSSVGKRKES